MTLFSSTYFCMYPELIARDVHFNQQKNTINLLKSNFSASSFSPEQRHSSDG